MLPVSLCFLESSPLLFVSLAIHPPAGRFSFIFAILINFSNYSISSCVNSLVAEFDKQHILLSPNCHASGANTSFGSSMHRGSIAGNIYLLLLLQLSSKGRICQLCAWPCHMTSLYPEMKKNSQKSVISLTKQLLLPIQGKRPIFVVICFFSLGVIGLP